MGGGVKQQSLGTQAELLQGAMSLIAGYINESWWILMTVRKYNSNFFKSRSKVAFYLNVHLLCSSCKEYKNLNSFFAIVMGLSNVAVSRLALTWEVSRCGDPAVTFATGIKTEALQWALL